MTARSLGFFVALVAVAVGLVLPWWRNHTALRDFYDYGWGMAGALRLSLGDRPYVDFLTPVQTLHYLAAALAESVFGPRYLSLTYANACLIVASFVGVVALLLRPLGKTVALLVGAAIVTASAGQHTIVWYNALGVMWIAGVIWLTAPERNAGQRRLWHLLIVCTFLWLGGMTKLTYQITALAFAALFAVRDGCAGIRSRRNVALTLATYGVFGVLAPLATELLYTGATLGQWAQNVIVGPRARLSLLEAIATWKFYLQTPHDYYKPMYFPFIGAWGVAVIAVATTVAAVRLRTARRPLWRWCFLASLAAGAWICGSVLLASNFDIGYMAGAAWLVLGTGIVLATTNESGQVARSGRVALSVAAVTLLAPAWQAAWHGTRALWSQTPIVRTELAAAKGLPPRLAYFDGIMVPANLLHSLEAFAANYEDLAARGVPPESFYFAHGAEALVRAVPEARHRGLPLWLHDGTSYGATEAAEIAHRLSSGNEIQVVVAMEAWNWWPHGMEWYLNARYRRDRLGPLFQAYLLRDHPTVGWKNPLAFATWTDSTAYAKDLEADEQFSLRHRIDGSFVGTRESGVLRIAAPLTRLQGEIVARRPPSAQSQASRFTWRLVTTGLREERIVLREEEVVLEAQQGEATRTFDEALAGNNVALEFELPPGEKLEAGFRRLHTDYASGDVAACPGPLDDTLDVQPQEKWAGGLLASSTPPSALRLGAGMAIFPEVREGQPELFAHTPSEIWLKIDGRMHGLRGEFGARPVTWTHRDALPGIVARIVFYRPGRVEVLFERTLLPREREQDRAPQSFEVELPGEEGWIALVFAPVEPDRIAYGHTWWRNVEIW